MKQIDIDTLTLEEIVTYEMDDLTALMQTIAGDMLVTGRKLEGLEGEYRELKCRLAYLSQAKGAVQSTLRSYRTALGD